MNSTLKPEPPADDGAQCCAAIRPGAPPYQCTAAEGHGGNHTAHGYDGKVFAVWPQS